MRTKSLSIMIEHTNSYEI